MVHVALLKKPINQFKPVQQSRNQALKAYCPNMYTVVGLDGLWVGHFSSLTKDFLRRVGKRKPKLYVV